MIPSPCPFKSCCEPIGENCYCKENPAGGCPILTCDDCQECDWKPTCKPCPVVTYSGQNVKCKKASEYDYELTSNTSGPFQAIQKEKYGSHNVILAGPSHFFSTYVSGCGAEYPPCNNAGMGSPILFNTII